MVEAYKATIEGLAVPLVFNKNIDHTYVQSATELRWGCWGRSSGGRVLTTGFGDIAATNCLASESGEADIIYGLTGLCHQTANRILFASLQTVERANGYLASVFVYGIYGVGHWPRKSTCLGETPATPSGFAPDEEQELEPMASDDEVAFDKSGLAEQFLSLVEQRGVNLNEDEKDRVIYIYKRACTTSGSKYGRERHLPMIYVLPSKRSCWVALELSKR